MANDRRIEFAKCRFFCQKFIVGNEFRICVPNLIEIGLFMAEI